MKKDKNCKSFLFVILIASFFFFPYFLHSHNYKYIHEPDSDFYFAHISYTEVKQDGKDTVVIREGRKAAEIAVLNLPLAPGDTICTSSRRCEIQFDTGTIIRLDVNTELTIETILAQSLSSWDKVSNLILHKGQVYVMYRHYGSRELFQVKAPYAAVKMKNGAVVMVKVPEEGGADVQVLEGRAFVMYGPDEQHVKEKKVKKSERLLVSTDHEALPGEFVRDTDFEKWNEYINKNFLELHKGKSFIPDPILRYPAAVVYFARKYSNLYGEWVWDKYFGWVWKPSFETYYPTGKWRPYYYGMWREVNGHLFWVPEEPWGWAPYHLGVWHWHKKRGWIWIPGSAFAPAWVGWSYYSGYYSWRPWTIWDWCYYMYSPYGYEYYSYWGYGYPYYWFYDDSRPGGAGTKPVLRKIRKGQMQKKTNLPYPIPREHRRAYRKILKAIRSRDGEIAESLRETPHNVLFVKKTDLNSKRLQDKIISARKFLKQGETLLSNKKVARVIPFRDPYRSAVSAFIRNLRVKEFRKYVTSISETKDKPSRLRKGVFVSERKTDVIPQVRLDSKRTALLNKKAPAERGGRYVFSPGASRFHRRIEPGFRDWNSDISAARRIGVKINYSSRSNEIRCPALGISSKSVLVRRGRHASRGGSHSRFSSSSYSGSHSSSSASSGGSRGSGGSRSGSHSSSSSKGVGGGRVHK